LDTAQTYSRPNTFEGRMVKKEAMGKEFESRRRDHLELKNNMDYS